MLYAFGFERVGVLVSDMYIVLPNPRPGQEGAERGVRIEVRLLERGELQGSIYSARPIEVGQPVWRADLLEAVDGPPGSLNRAHHHPAFRGWEPGRRVFDADLTAGPVQFVGDQLADLEGLAERASLTVDEQFLNDAEAWVWLTTLQVALRSTAQTNGLHSDEQLAAADEQMLSYVRTLQSLLFDLAACF